MKIAYIYYDLLNLYGEDGNIKIIENVLKFNKIKYKILYLSLEDELNFNEYDLVYIGSGTENNQKIALNHLIKYQKEIKEYIESDKFFFVTGNALELFGDKIITKEKEFKTLEIFDFVSNENKRLMRDVYIDGLDSKIIGFENHTCFIDKIDYPLFDNEGIHYKNFFATYILGPILVRNPFFLEYFMNSLTNQNLKYDLKLEKKAYHHFIEQFKETV